MRYYEDFEVGYIGMEQTPVAAVSSLAMTDVVNHTSARPGDLLRNAATVTEKRRSTSRPGTGVVTFACGLRNQREELVLSRTNIALIQCRPG